MTEPPKILVVDDERAIRRIVALRCRQAGFEADFAEDGAAAWETAQGNSYHLIITDHQMPNMNGIELCRKLRGHQQHLDTPIIMITAIADELDHELLKQQLCIILLQKPHDMADLTTLISQYAKPPRA